MRNLLKSLWTQPLHLAIALGGLCFPVAVIRFMSLYSRNRPVNDDLQHSAPIAIEAMAGTLSWSDMLRLGDGIHVIFFSNLTTLVSVWLTRWDTRFDAWVVFACYCLMLILAVGLVARERPAAGWAAMVPMAALVFTLQKDFGYVVGVIFLWGYVNLIVLAALWVLATGRPTSPKFALVAGLTFLSGLASTNGVMMPVLLFPALLIFGYRKRWQIAAWIVFSGLHVWSYLARPGLDVAGNSANADFSVGKLIADLPRYIEYALVVLGRVFAFDNTDFATWAGVIGIALVLVNGLWLIRRGYGRAVTLWWTLAVVGIASAGLISLGRLDKFGLGGATAPWYLDIALCLWLSVIALMALTLTESRVRRVGRLLSTVNVLLLVTSIPFYSYATAQTIWFRQGSVEGLLIQEDCFFNLPRTGNPNCLIGTAVRPELTNELAIYGLTMFASQSYDSVLPEGHADSTVLVETASPWISDAVMRLFLPDIASERVAHVVPEGASHNLTYTREPRLSYDPTYPDLSSMDAVVHVQQAGLPLTDGPLSLDEYAISHRSDFNFAGDAFTVTRYERIFGDGEPDLTFGDEVVLLDWQADSLTVAAGESVAITSTWTTFDAVEDDLHLTVVVAVDGVGLARDDGPFAVPIIGLGSVDVW
jgi:hypothetical protein